ncbi:MAG: cobyrinate a,c-diamide synthase, partial [Actinomycetota bacterium]|nr:cobyrinate a,c-diamide synthase [Actinomycetota bacterium]
MVVAGTGSGAGKTTVALGLVGAFRRRGQTVQTFKVGPDFVDCAYLAHASRRPCRNLDSWMLGRDGVVHSFAHGIAEADCAVVEGTMGIFDGHGGADSAQPAAVRFPGSTAELARLIGSPVVLVVDVANLAETAAAVALGVRELDPDLDVIGVILNNVPSDYRRRVVEDAVWNWARLPVLGALPRLPYTEIPEVRTGLLPLSQNPHVDAALDQLTGAVERHCDLALIERLMTRALAVHAGNLPHARSAAGGGVRIGVAFDDAFCFYYAENLELLEDAGAQVVTFSPLEDRTLPRELDAIYMGGGVSEMFVPQLAANHSFIDSLRRAHARRVPIYAECGGLLYCARTLHASDGSVHTMAGLVPFDVALAAGLLHTGYRELRLAADSILGDAGTTLRGHEFHFARLLAGVQA